MGSNPIYVDLAAADRAEDTIYRTDIADTTRK